jgi:phosphate uptake regulator
MRRLATYVMGDSRTLGHTIKVVVTLKALERIGDHAKNIAEYVFIKSMVRISGTCSLPLPQKMAATSSESSADKQ